ncbi:MAG: GNAT family N-acetyltransferase [Candidatus Binatia bacterium]
MIRGVKPVCEIQSATERDIDALARLIAAFRGHLRLAEPDSGGIPASVRRLLHDPDAQFLIALGRTGEVVGYAALRLRYSLWVAALEAQLDDLFVMPSARRGGVGRQLLGAALDAARSRGAKVVGVTTNERNIDALRLYERAGFRAQRARWDGGRQLWLELPT